MSPVFPPLALALVLAAASFLPLDAAEGCVLPADPYMVIRASTKSIGEIQSPEDYLEIKVTPDGEREYFDVEEDRQYHFFGLWDPGEGVDADGFPNAPEKVLAAQELFPEDMARYGNLLPASHYRSTVGKLIFRLAEMGNRAHADFRNPKLAVDIGGEVKGGKYQFTGGSPRFSFDDPPLDPDALEHAPGIERFDELPVMGQIVPIDADHRITITEAKYRENRSAVWALEDYDVFWNMDKTGLGANIQDEEPDPIVDEVSGDLPFTYDVPSDPLMYQVEVHSALRFRLKDVHWDYTEQLQERVEHPDDAGVEPPELRRKIWIDVGNPQNSTIDIAGILARDTRGLSKETKAGTMLVAVRDITPPSHAHVDPTRLVGTTGETLAQAFGNPEALTVRVIDNNPWIQAGADDGVKYSAANRRVDIYYSLQTYDYEWDSSLQKVRPIPKFIWARADPSRVSVTNIQVFDPFGRIVSSLPNDNQNPIGSMVTYSVPLEALDEPQGWHFANTSPNWGEGRRLKVIVAANDGSGNVMPSLPQGGGGWVPDLPTNNGKQAVHVPAGSTVTTNDILDERSAEAQIPADGILRSRSGTVYSNPPVSPGFPFPDVCGGCDPEIYSHFIPIEITDNDRPGLLLRVTDTKYNRSFTFGDAYVGDAKRKAYQRARDSQGRRIRTRSNKVHPDDLATPDRRPFSDDSPTWTFSNTNGDRGNGEGLDQQEAQIRAGTYNPSEYRRLGDPDPPGYWVDEDVRLIFEVIARDNVNGHAERPFFPARGIVSEYTLKGAPAGFWSITDSPSGLSTIDYPEYIFRNPNMPSREHGGQPCKVSARVEDQSGNQREIVVHFFVMDNSLKMLSLEEDSERRFQ